MALRLYMCVMCVHVYMHHAVPHCKDIITSHIIFLYILYISYLCCAITLMFSCCIAHTIPNKILRYMLYYVLLCYSITIAVNNIRVICLSLGRINRMSHSVSCLSYSKTPEDGEVRSSLIQ
jgi:hypothetical protein